MMPPKVKALKKSINRTLKKQKILGKYHKSLLINFLEMFLNTFASLKNKKRNTTFNCGRNGVNINKKTFLTLNESNLRGKRTQTNEEPSFPLLVWWKVVSLTSYKVKERDWKMHQMWLVIERSKMSNLVFVIVVKTKAKQNINTMIDKVKVSVRKKMCKGSYHRLAKRLGICLRNALTKRLT